MTQFGLGIIGFVVQIMLLAVNSLFEFVVNPLLTFVVDGFTATAGN